MNVNTVGAEQLERTGQLDGTRARYLIDYRQQHGPFRSWDDVKAVPSYEDGMIERLRAAGFTVGDRGDSSQGSSDAGHGAQHDLNPASRQELEATHMIDGERADRLISYRKEHVPFAIGTR